MLAARMPPAPGMFSTMNGLANLLLNFSTSKRAKTSGLPPGPEGAISRTVWVGRVILGHAAGESIASSAVRTADVRCIETIIKGLAREPGGGLSVLPSAPITAHIELV